MKLFGMQPDQTDLFFMNRFVSEMYIPLIGVDSIKCVMNRIVPSIHRHIRPLYNLIL